MLETISDSTPALSTAAGRAAERNWRANLQAIARTQPALVESVAPFVSPMEWVYARDGALSAIDGHQWWAGCSLPRRAAEFMLAGADLSGVVLCFLTPTTAAQLRVALHMMSASQALIALVPDLQTLTMILACEDFSGDVNRHRLYFAWGEAWENELARLFDEHPGLPIPNQFVRPILVDSSPADALVQPAQNAFSACASRRAKRIAAVRDGWRKGRSIGKLCLVAPSHFRLWDDAGAALATTIGDAAEFTIARFDSDDPASASPLALAEAAAQCDALLTPNTARAMLPDLLPMDLPWATWITSPRIPSAEQAGPHDTLILADPAWKPLALAAGWSADRIFLGDWPGAAPAPAHAPTGTFEVPADRVLALIFDTRPLSPPPRVEEYSSHRLLWEAIAHELTADPFAAGQLPERYLSQRMTQAAVLEEGFDRSVFLDGLIAHACAQGLARVLVKKGLKIHLYGTGWDQIDDLRNRHAGPVRTREQFHRAVSSATALVHVWPTSHAHPIDAAGKPVLRDHARRDAFLRAARIALSGGARAPKGARPPISVKTIRAALSM